MEACRPAVPDDLPLVVDMARALREETSDVRGAGLWALHEGLPEPLADAYQGFLDGDDRLLVVGTIDDVPVGFAAARTEELHDGRTLGVIVDLYVDPEARAVGLGEAMSEFLLEWFEARGCVGVDAWALPGHRMTKNFFEDQGFVSRGIVVHRRLDTT